MSVFSDKEIGKRIKEAREKLNLSQYNLYEKTGISTTQISAYENGKRNIGLQTIAKIAIALETSIDQLCFGPSSLRPINIAVDEGELIINCVCALFEKGVISCVPVESDFVMGEPIYNYQIGFVNYFDILNDMVRKLDDFEKNKLNYPDPNGFKKQILAAASKQINNRGK